MAVSGRWHFHPSWRVRLATSRERSENALLALQYYNRSEQSAEAGIDYLARSGSSAGLMLRSVHGKFPNHHDAALLGAEDRFVQDELKANIVWNYSAITQFQFLGGWVRRRYGAITARDADSPNARLAMVWNPRSKITLTGETWNEYAAIEQGEFNYALNRGRSIGAAWTLTSKLTLDAKLVHERRRYQAAITTGALALPSDTTRQASLDLLYQPSAKLGVKFALLHEQRSGTQASGMGSYRANVATIKARVEL